jgi:hypothetical protein
MSLFNVYISLANSKGAVWHKGDANKHMGDCNYGQWLLYVLNLPVGWSSLILKRSVKQTYVIRLNFNFKIIKADI